MTKTVSGDGYQLSSGEEYANLGFNNWYVCDILTYTTGWLKEITGDKLAWDNITSYTFPETNIAPENGWMEYDRFLLGWPIFRGELLVSESV